MNSLELLEVGREAIWVLIKVSAPIMLISLAVGLIISLFQALTQIQEMTLTFVPKMLVVFLSLVLLAPYMVATLSDFADSLDARIVNVERADSNE
jgi:flagellar biosynthetic protein FliQ